MYTSFVLTESNICDGWVCVNRYSRFFNLSGPYPECTQDRSGSYVPICVQLPGGLEGPSVGQMPSAGPTGPFPALARSFI